MKCSAVRTSARALVLHPCASLDFKSSLINPTTTLASACKQPQQQAKNINNNQQSWRRLPVSTLIPLVRSFIHSFVERCANGRLCCVDSLVSLSLLVQSCTTPHLLYFSFVPNQTNHSINIKTINNQQTPLKMPVTRVGRHRKKKSTCGFNNAMDANVLRQSRVSRTISM